VSYLILMVVVLISVFGFSVLVVVYALLHGLALRFDMTCVHTISPWKLYMPIYGEQGQLGCVQTHRLQSHHAGNDSILNEL